MREWQERIARIVLKRIVGYSLGGCDCVEPRAPFSTVGPFGDLPIRGYPARPAVWRRAVTLRALQPAAFPNTNEPTRLTTPLADEAALPLGSALHLFLPKCRSHVN